MRKLFKRERGVLRTPAGISTPAILADVGPTMRGSGLTTPDDIRSVSFMTAVYKT